MAFILTPRRPAAIRGRRGIGMGDDATASLHRTHREIFHLARLYARLVEELPEGGPAPDDLPDLRRVLYGLHAIVELHMAQEEEFYLGLGDEHPAADPGAEAPATAA